jgi:release factor glutamine methyltransferase
MNIDQFLTQHKDGHDPLDSQILLAHIIGHPRTWLLSHLDAPLTPPQLDSATQAFAQLRAGTPLPYILGHWEFYGLDLNVTKDVLIPRPETELLVERAVAWIKAAPQRTSIADIGTGSGAIAVSLATQLPNVHILATDISSAALNVARSNAKKFNVEKQIEFIECDLLPDDGQWTADDRVSSTVSPLGKVSGPSSFNLICANLPYIPTQTLHELPIYGREPTLALDGGADGLDVYRRLLKLAPPRLAPHSMMLFELEASQGTSAFNLAYDMLDEVSIQLHQDFSGHDRLLEISLP